MFQYVVCCLCRAALISLHMIFMDNWRISYVFAYVTGFAKIIIHQKLKSILVTYIQEPSLHRLM